MKRLIAVEGRLDGVEQAIRDHDAIMKKLSTNTLDFTDENLVIVPVVEFDLDSYVIRNNHSIDLDKLAAALVQQPNNFTVYVAGHTDQRASDEYNDRLSQNRANAVKNYLIAKGVKQPIVATGYGKRVPLRADTTEEGYQRNRRVEIRFSQR